MKLMNEEKLRFFGPDLISIETKRNKEDGTVDLIVVTTKGTITYKNFRPTLAHLEGSNFEFSADHPQQNWRRQPMEVSTGGDFHFTAQTVEFTK